MLLILGISLLVAVIVSNTIQLIERNKEELKKNQVEIQRLQDQKTKDEETRLKLENEKKDLEIKLQSKAQSQVRVASATTVVRHDTSSQPSDNETIVWNFLIQRFTRNQTAGIMGNLQQEHGFQTSGDGLAQWNGGRKARLMSMADPYSLSTQLAFLMIELNESGISIPDDVVSATRGFQNRFERCGVCNEPNRIRFAQAILNRH